MEIKNFFFLNNARTIAYSDMACEENNRKIVGKKFLFILVLILYFFGHNKKGANKTKNLTRLL